MSNVIRLANELFPAVLSGEKKLTVREGIRSYSLGSACFIPSDSIDPRNFDLDIDIMINCLTYKKIKDVTNKEALADGFKNAQHMLKGLQKFYPDIKEDDLVTLVWFKLIN